MRQAILLVALAAPTAAAIDVLPSELHLGDVDARILVRSSEGSVRVETEPSILAAATVPGAAETDGYAPTPRVLVANATWRGIDGIVVVALRRADPLKAVDVTIEDGTRTGVSLEWPAATRDAPIPTGLAIVAIAGALALRRRDPLSPRGPSRSR